MPRYFFDTYALIEIIKNNPNYVKYSDEIVTTTVFNLVELYYSILRDYSEEKAKSIYNKFKDYVIDVDDEIIFSDMKLKLSNKKFSYTDCIGYVYAIKNNLVFLTGDKEFQGLENVEFAK